MAKRNITYEISSFIGGKTITTEKKTVPAIFEDNCIKYIVDGTKNIYNVETNTFTRENRSLKIVSKFIKGEITEILTTAKEINKTVSINIKTNELIQEKNNIRIEYTIDEIVYKYSLEVEE